LSVRIKSPARKFAGNIKTFPLQLLPQWLIEIVDKRYFPQSTCGKNECLPVFDHGQLIDKIQKAFMMFAKIDP
jgi:hypothetical protein